MAKASGGMVAGLTRAYDEGIDTACWDSVASGDTAAFHRRAAVAAALYDFGVCAGPRRALAIPATVPFSDVITAAEVSAI